MTEDDVEHVLRGALERLPGAAERRQQDSRTGARPEQLRHRSRDVVGAHHPVAADDRLILLDRPSAQRHHQHAGAVAEPQQCVDIAGRLDVHPDDRNRRVVQARAGAQLIDQRVDGVRQDVLRLVDRADRPADLAEREEALDVYELANRADLLAREDRRFLEEVLVAGTPPGRRAARRAPGFRPPPPSTSRTAFRRRRARPLR